MSRGVALSAVMCLVLASALIDTFAFPALLPVFFREWGLTNTEAGWIAGVYFGGYAVAVAVLVSLTDRIDARRVVIAGTATIFLAATGFALFAEGLWTALLFRTLSGVGLAGTYMPGLRALVDRYEGAHQPRIVAFYTATFSLGTALSFLLVGWVEAGFGWRPAVAAGAATALAATGLAALLPAASPSPPPGMATRLLDFRPVFANRPAMGYVLGYGVHAWELFGLRSWLVVFLAFSLGLGTGAGGLAPTTVASLGALVAMAASILGGEVAARGNRPRVISIFMLGSAAMACVIGFSAALPYAWVVILVLLYNALIQADSAALTTGAVEVAEDGRRGATLAVHSLVGFVGAALGPIAVGVMLDLSGGGRSVLSWGLAFASMGVVGLLGPLALRLLARR
jgi:MFS family permease